MKPVFDFCSNFSFFKRLIFVTYSCCLSVQQPYYTTMKCFHLCTCSFKDLRAEDIIVSKMSAVTMVTGQLTVPCDSISNLYSQVQLFFSPSMVMPNMDVILLYTKRAMQKTYSLFFCQKCFTSGGQVLNQCFTSLRKYALLMHNTRLTLLTV